MEEVLSLDQLTKYHSKVVLLKNKPEKLKTYVIKLVSSFFYSLKPNFAKIFTNWKRKVILLENRLG